VNIEY